MNLPIVNAVNEGTVILMSVAVWFGVVGNEKWKAESFIPDWSVMTLFVVSMCVLVVVTTATKFIKQHIKRHKGFTNIRVVEISDVD